MLSECTFKLKITGEQDAWWRKNASNHHGDWQKEPKRSFAALRTSIEASLRRDYTQVDISSSPCGEYLIFHATNLQGPSKAPESEVTHAA